MKVNTDHIAELEAHIQMAILSLEGSFVKEDIDTMMHGKSTAELKEILRDLRYRQINAGIRPYQH